MGGRSALAPWARRLPAEQCPAIDIHVTHIVIVLGIESAVSIQIDPCVGQADRRFDLDHIDSTILAVFLDGLFTLLDNGNVRLHGFPAFHWSRDIGLIERDHGAVLNRIIADCENGERKAQENDGQNPLHVG